MAGPRNPGDVIGKGLMARPIPVYVEAKVMWEGTEAEVGNSSTEDQ